MINMVFKVLSIFVVNNFNYDDFIRIFGNVVEMMLLCVVGVYFKRLFKCFDGFVVVMS